jgi:hypothetical protein
MYASSVRMYVSDAYVCVYVCMYVYDMYVCVCHCMYASDVYVRMQSVYVCMPGCVYVCMHVYLCVCM